MSRHTATRPQALHNHIQIRALTKLIHHDKLNIQAMGTLPRRCRASSGDGRGSHCLRTSAGRTGTCTKRRTSKRVCTCGCHAESTQLSSYPTHHVVAQQHQHQHPHKPLRYISGGQPHPTPPRRPLCRSAVTHPTYRALTHYSPNRWSSQSTPLLRLPSASPWPPYP